MPWIINHPDVSMFTEGSAPITVGTQIKLFMHSFVIH